MYAKWKKLVLALILVLVVIYLFIEVGSMSPQMAFALKGYTAMTKPSFWPRVLLVGFLITGLLKLFLSTRKPWEQQPEKNLKHFLVPKVMISICIVTLYCFLSGPLGFPFATMAFMAGYMWFMGVRKVTMLISVPFLVTQFILLVFWRFLYIAVPKGEGIFLIFSNLLIDILRFGA